MARIGKLVGQENDGERVLASGSRCPHAALVPSLTGPVLGSSEILFAMSNHVELGRPAQRDLRTLPDGDRSRIVRALREDLAADPLPPNLELVAQRRRAPWLRLRSGDWPALLRPSCVLPAASGVDPRHLASLR